MSTIDPARLTSILHSLSVKKLDKTTATENKNHIPDTSPSLIIDKTKERDKEQLKKSLRERLTRLKKQDPDFENKAPAAVIKEILLWEFGENIMLHPEFNHIASNIASQVDTSKKLSDYLKVLVVELTENIKK